MSDRLATNQTLAPAPTHFTEHKSRKRTTGSSTSLIFGLSSPTIYRVWRALIPVFKVTLEPAAFALHAHHLESSDTASTSLACTENPRRVRGVTLEQLAPGSLGRMRIPSPNSQAINPEGFSSTSHELPPPSLALPIARHLVYPSMLFGHRSLAPGNLSNEFTAEAEPPIAKTWAPLDQTPS